MTKTSISTSQRPLVRRKNDNSLLFFLTPYNQAEIPERKDKNRRTVVGYPAGKEQEDAGVLQVGGAIQESVAVEIIPDVVEGHDDHNESSQKIDGFDPRFYSGHNLPGNGC